jgi:hypothetical protein
MSIRVYTEMSPAIHHGDEREMGIGTIIGWRCESVLKR